MINCSWQRFKHVLVRQKKQGKSGVGVNEGLIRLISYIIIQ